MLARAHVQTTTTRSERQINARHSAARIEVERYFAVGNEPFQSDVLVIWGGGGISKRFPVLAKIAQDVLSVCASSTPSETQFSRTRIVANPCRNCLSHKSMEASLCLKSW